MIEIGAASSGVENTAGVGLEDACVSLNSNGDRSGCDGAAKSTFTVPGDSYDCVVTEYSCVRILLASTLYCGV